MDMTIIYIITLLLFVIIFGLITFLLIRNNTIRKIRLFEEQLERERNVIASLPIVSELNKIDAIKSGENIKDKYNNWKDRYDKIKNKKLSVITDMLIEVDAHLESRNIIAAKESLNKLEMEVYKVRTAANNLLEEIREITMSEERNRSIIIKLKSKYRDLEQKFNSNKQLYGKLHKFIELQFENIEKNFQIFEEVMESKEYQGVITIVKVIDEMVAHIEVIIEEIPDIILLLENVIPTRMKELKEIYNKMIDKKYPLGYLKVEYNFSEIDKKMGLIEDKLKILNIENSMFELKTFLDYLDNLYQEFSYEKRSKKVFDETSRTFKEKIIKINNIVSDVYGQLDDIKSMYKLSDNDLDYLRQIEKELLDVNNNYNMIIRELKDKKKPYSKLKVDIIFLSNRLKDIEIDLDNCLKSLGSMQDDEVRAREQLDEIALLLKKCKSKMRSYKLPIISNSYFIELSEANEAIEEIIKELKKVPITIKTLNTRVDTARDLALKLYNTTNEMIKTAKLSEMIITYGNRYRPLNFEINSGLDLASVQFFKGNYKDSLQIAINSINIVEPEIYKKMLTVYGNEE